MEPSQTDRHLPPGLDPSSQEAPLPSAKLCAQAAVKLIPFLQKTGGW